MASIFHYTDASGLIGIISSKSLFATHYRCLNDSSEAGIIHELLLPILESEVAELTPRLVERGLLNEKFYKDHGESGHRLQAQSIFNAIGRTVDNVSPFFVLSFCRHDLASDEYGHGLLSQWRGYSGGGGFAIEFDEAAIDKLMNVDNSAYVYGMAKTADVLYENFDSLFKPEQYKGAAAAMISRLFKDHKLTDLFGEKNIDEVVRDYITTAPFLKNKGFKEEREYRMALAPVRKNRIDDRFEGSPKPISFRNRNGLVVPYIQLSFADSVASPIKSLIVGPHPNQRKQEQSVRMLLESHNLNIDIRTSQIPFLSGSSLD